MRATATAPFTIAAMSLILCALASIDSADAQASGAVRGVTGARDLSAHAQATPKSARARIRIRVTPRYPYRTQSLPYPPPYDIEYPGPGYVRQCTSWLAQENRLSGAVIVPRMRCWWEQG